MKNYMRIGGVLLVAFMLVMSGCAFGKFGKATMTNSEISVPAGLVGQGKAEIIKTLGVPDVTVKAGDTEYWGYSNKCGYFYVLYGKTLAKDLVLEFKNGAVVANTLVDKGSSQGILAAQGSVAN